MWVKLLNNMVTSHTSSLVNGFLSKVGHVSLKIKKSETSSLVYKFGKTTKISKISLLQNHHCKTSIGTELTTINVLKTLPF
jgi:hypothetical protein